MEATLAVLAAGMGSRYGGLKQIEGIDGQGHTIVDYSLHDAAKVGFRRAVFIIRKEMKDVFLSLVSSRRWYRDIEVDFAYQEVDMLPTGFYMPENRTKPWGTAHAIACLCGKVDTPFVVINADDFYGREAFCKIYGFLCHAERGEQALVAYKLKNTLSKNGAVSRGVCMTEGGYLTEIFERSGISFANGKIYDGEGNILLPETSVSMNLWGFTPEIIDECKSRFPLFLKENLCSNPEKCEFYLPSVVSEMIVEKRIAVKVIETEEKWYGVTYKKDKSEVSLALENMVNKGIYPLNL